MQAVATHYVVFFPQGVAAGTAATGLIVAEDAQNHIVTGYTGTANISSTDAGATLPATVTFDHGYAKFKVTFATAGVQTVTATDAATSSLTGSATTNVAAAATVTHYVLLVRPGAVVGSPTTIVVVAEDAENHIVPGYAGTGTVSVTDTAATFPATVTFDHGYAKFEVTFSTTGDQTVTVSDSATSSITGTATTNVIAATASGGGWGQGWQAARDLLSAFRR